MDNPNLSSVIQELIGCGWGRKIWTDDDKEPCVQQAVKLVSWHVGTTVINTRLCQSHLNRFNEETDPHEG